MKILPLVTLLVLSISFSSCSDHKKELYPQQENNVSVSPISNDVKIEADADNAAFDINALSELVKKCTSPEELEKQINDPANNINNLDLDKDGHIDFLNVAEVGDKQLEINDASVNPAVMVARLTITPDNDNQTGSMMIDGDPAYCGSYYHYYHPHMSLGSMLFMAYLLRPHAYYMPMYGYGHYPRYYTSSRTVVRRSYRPSTSSYVSSAPRTSRFGNSSSNRSSLSSPSSSQRSFSSRSSSKPIGSGGFGTTRFSRSSASDYSSRPSSSFSSRSSDRAVGSGGFGNSASRSSGGGFFSRRSSNSDNGSSRSSFGSRRSSSSDNGGSSRSFWGGRSSGGSSYSRGSSFSRSSSRSSGRSFGRRR